MLISLLKSKGFFVALFFGLCVLCWYLINSNADLQAELTLSNEENQALIEKNNKQEQLAVKRDKQKKTQSDKAKKLIKKVNEVANENDIVNKSMPVNFCLLFTDEESICSPSINANRGNTSAGSNGK